MGLGIAVAAALAVGVWLYARPYLETRSVFYRTYDVDPAALELPTDPAAIERGRHLAFAVAKCVLCHEEDMAGKVIWDNHLGRFTAPNLTAGKGGVGGELTVDDYVRAVRHGVGRDRQPLFYMSARYFYEFTDSDLAAMIAWIESLPPVDRELPPFELRRASRKYWLAGFFPDLVHAHLVDHEVPHPGGPPPGVTPEYGRYLVYGATCRACHGDELAGHPNPAYSRNAPSLAAGSRFSTWTVGDFIRAMRTGEAPGGRRISPEYMNLEYTPLLTDDELTAMWLFLKSLPAPAGAEP
jgi:mono/diheme cytochrome c family protein